jgi:hypothetical protein
MVSKTHHFYSGYQIKEDETDGARSTHGTQVRRGFLWANLEERDLLGVVGISGNIILKWMFKKQSGRAWNALIWPG